MLGDDTEKVPISVMPTFDSVRCSCNPFRRSFEMIVSFYWKDGRTITFTASWPLSASNMRAQNTLKSRVYFRGLACCQPVSKKLQ